MDFYYLLVDLFACEKPLSYFIALALTLAAGFSALVTMNRIRAYINAPDLNGFKSVESASKILNVISIFLYQWCLFAAVYLLTYNRIGRVGMLYIAVTVLAAGAVVLTVVVKSKYSKAKNVYNSLYLKANKGNLSALMGNPLGLKNNEQDALNSILTSHGNRISNTKSDPTNSVSPSNERHIGSARSDPLNDILTGAAEIKKTTPVEAAKGNLEETAAEELRECPFCKKQVEKKFPICIYCGMLIPDRDKDYRNRNEALSGWERVE